VERLPSTPVGLTDAKLPDALQEPSQMARLVAASPERRAWVGEGLHPPLQRTQNIF